MNVKVVQEDEERLLVATVDIAPHEVIVPLTGDLSAEPEMYSIQTGFKEHVLVSNEIRYSNHECVSPAAYFDFSCKPWVLKARRHIKQNEQVTSDYTTTEYKMAAGFDCKCNNVACRKVVKGFYYLSKTEKEELIRKKHVSPVIISLHERDTSKQGLI